MVQDSCNDSIAVTELTESLGRLFESGLYSDLTVVCGEDTYKVHKAIVCPRSEFFSRACRDGRWKEGESNQIVLYREEPETARAEGDLIKWTIHYLYHLDYLELDSQDIPPIIDARPAPRPSPRRNGLGGALGRPPLPPLAGMYAFPNAHESITLADQDSHFSQARQLVSELFPKEVVDPKRDPLTHARMYSIADFYEIAGLKQLAEKKYEQAANQYWNSSEFAESIHVVFTTSVPEDRGLRSIVKEVLLKNMTLLNKPEIEVAMREVPDLAFDMLKGLWLRNGGRNDYLPPPSPTQPLSDVWRTLR